MWLITVITNITNVIMSIIFNVGTSYIYYLLFYECTGMSVL